MKAFTQFGIMGIKYPTIGNNSLFLQPMSKMLNRKKLTEIPLNSIAPLLIRMILLLVCSPFATLNLCKG